MREDDYTGSPIDDDDELSQIENILTFEIDSDEDIMSYDDDENEQIIHVGGAANGATTLREAAEMLYDFAEELLTLSGEGWEIVDDIANGHGTAVRFDIDGDDESGPDDE